MPSVVVLREAARLARREAGGLTIGARGPLGRASGLAQRRDVWEGAYPDDVRAHVRRREHDLEAAAEALVRLAYQLDRSADDQEDAERAGASAQATTGRGRARAV